MGILNWVSSVTWGEPGDDGEWMKEEGNGWRSRRIGGGAGESVEEQENGWRSRIWQWRRADRGECTPKAH